MRRFTSGGILAAMAAASLAALAGGGCEGDGVNRTECLARANEILKESLRHDRSDVRALALEAYRDLNRVAPAEELQVILARDLVPTRFEAAMARAEQARRTSLRVALLSAMRDQGSSPGGRSEPFRQAEAVVPRALDSHSPVLRAVALDVMREVQSRLNREPGASLKELLTDPRTPGVLTVLLTEAEQEHRQDHALLRELMTKETDANVRLALAYGLARAGDDRYMPLLASGLADKEPSLRRNAALILGLLGNRSAADMLGERLKDTDLVARLTAAEAMARLGDTRGLPVLRNLALGRTPAEPWIQTSAILALGRVGIPQQDINHLRLLGAKGAPVDGSVRLAAWGARGMLGDYSQMSILAECASGRAELDTQGRAMALQLLAQVSYGPAWRDACHSLSASDVTVRLSAAWAVLAFGNPRAEKVIEAIEKSSTPQRLTEEDILRPYRAPTPSTNTPGAAHPLGPLGPGGPVAPLAR